MKKVLALMVMVLFVISALLTGCGTPAPAQSPSTSTSTASAAPSTSAAATTPASTPANTEPIKIGFLGNLAGPDAYIGQASKLALEDYAKELNEKGGLLGRKVEIIFYDYSQDAATESVNAANRLIQQDKVIAILGPSGSIAAMPIAPVVDAAKIPVIATSATNVKVTMDDVTKKVHPYMFRVCFIDSYQGKALANFAAKDLGLKKVGIIAAVQDPYAQGIIPFFTEEFEKQGGKIVANEGYNDKDVEFRAQVSKCADAGAEALFCPPSAYKDVGMIAKQAAALGKKFTYLLPDGVYAKELLEVAGPQLEGAYMSTGITEDDPAYDAYKKAFTEKHAGQSANIYVFYTLDAMKLLEAAVAKANSVDPVAIRDALENMKDAKLYTDTVSIEPDTHNPHNKAVSILKITGSKYSLFKTYKPE